MVVFTTFEKAVLVAIAGSAVLIALVVAAKGSTVAGVAPALGAGLTATVGGVTSGGIAPGIVTVGDATVKVKPDIAVIIVGAVAQAATAAEAQSAVAERTDRILKRAKELGIADKDTKTAGYQITPQYASRGGDQPPRITGYQATQQIVLTFRNVDGTGKALDALVQGDAANQVSIRFTLEDPKPSQAEARRLAIEDARSRADAMSKSAGVRLGKILAVTDAGSPSPIERFALAPAAAPLGGTQVPVGDLDVVVRVQVQFEIQ